MLCTFSNFKSTTNFCLVVGNSCATSGGCDLATVDGVSTEETLVELLRERTKNIQLPAKTILSEICCILLYNVHRLKFDNDVTELVAKRRILALLDLRCRSFYKCTLAVTTCLFALSHELSKFDKCSFRDVMVKCLSNNANYCKQTTHQYKKTMVV